MKTNRLSNAQLFSLHQNIRVYDKGLRGRIEAEWDARGLDDAQFPASEFERSLQEKLSEPLAWKWRILVMLIPFPSPVHPIVAAQLMDRGFQRKFKDFYFFRAIGFGLWYGVVLIFGMDFPFWVLVFTRIVP